jgi:hypothetical protein
MHRVTDHFNLPSRAPHRHLVGIVRFYFFFQLICLQKEKEEEKESFDSELRARIDAVAAPHAGPYQPQLNDSGHACPRSAQVASIPVASERYVSYWSSAVLNDQHHKERERESGEGAPTLPTLSPAPSELKPQLLWTKTIGESNERARLHEAVSAGLHEAGCAGDSSSPQVQEPRSLQVSKSPSPRHRGRPARSRSAANRLDGVNGPRLPPSLLISEHPSHLGPLIGGPSSCHGRGSAEGLEV